MVEISSGSFAPPQSAIAPSTTTVAQPAQDESDADERAVRKAGESDTGGGGTAGEVPRKRRRRKHLPAAVGVS